MIHVIATISLKPGTRAAYLQILQQLVPLVRAEHGCIDYCPTIDQPAGLAAQPAPRPDVVTVVERWSDLEALKAHLAAPHMAAYRDKVKDMVTGLTLHVLEPVG